MRKGAETIAQSLDTRSTRGSRRARRNTAVWLVSRATGAAAVPLTQTPPSPTPIVTEALALDHVAQREMSAGEARRCALIVDRDPELAETLAHALNARFEPRQRVRFVRDSRLFGAALRAPETGITVIDASASDDDAVECFLQLRAAPGMDTIEAVFITASASSFRLSQLGANRGVVLRQPHRLEDIASFIAEALAEE
jgi:CheY-like chemotaxis protein